MTDFTRRDIIALAGAAAVLPIVATADHAEATAQMLPEEGQMFVVKRDEQWFLMDHESKFYGPYESDFAAIHAASPAR